MNFSKSKYCQFAQCPKMCWLNKYRPELATDDDDRNARFGQGNSVGELAKRYFGNFVDVTVRDGDGNPNISAMVEATKRAIEAGETNICEAAFLYDGLYCAVDILRKVGHGYEIYEVKSATSVKSVYYTDVAYQKYVLEKCGINVCGTFVMHINNKYVRSGELDLKQLFEVADVSERVSVEYELVEDTLKRASEVMASEDMPLCRIGPHCSTPYKCAFWEFCASDLPKPSVFDVYNGKGWKWYDSGIVSFDDLYRSGEKLSAIQRRQVEYYLFDRGTYADITAIKRFLGELSYPLYFLDFETMQLAVPEYDGTRPYQQIPFQYSLHYIECEGGDVKHKEYLASPFGDPRRGIAESLVENIPSNVIVLAYSKGFEGSRLSELADAFPDLSEHLRSIRDNLRDLIVPFSGGAYYNRAMGGKFSIKSVLPAVFPSDPELDYHNLSEVHNGTEAMTIFPAMRTMTEEERQEARKNLLEYCKLDTYAMVKLWQELVRVVNSSPAAKETNQAK